jgi:hypothetical protein
MGTITGSWNVITEDVCIENPEVGNLAPFEVNCLYLYFSQKTTILRRVWV